MKSQFQTMMIQKHSSQVKKDIDEELTGLNLEI